ncbi:hypothetical protein PG990_013641 [Apiospora arundinis]|uniref:Secreted protein n=1 Tax=Apiospora arundinis TaxID=335852 RepID=A0ABR2IAH4_9PEZI
MGSNGNMLLVAVFVLLRGLTTQRRGNWARSRPVRQALSSWKAELRAGGIHVAIGTGGGGAYGPRACQGSVRADVSPESPALHQSVHRETAQNT